MEELKEQKQLPKNFRFTLFIFYQILWVLVIIIAAMATYTAAKDAVIGNSGREFTDYYISIKPIGVYFASNGTIEENAMNAMTAATAGIMWAIAVVLAGFWNEMWILYKTNSEEVIRKKNVPILIMLIVIAVVGTAVWGYQIADCTWIHNFNFDFIPGHGTITVDSYAKIFDGGTLANSKGINFANIWNVTVATTVFNGLFFVFVIPTIVLSAMTYNDWRISA